MSSSNAEELAKDLEEFQRLSSEATRPRTKKFLASEIQRIEKEIDNLKNPSNAAATAPSSISSAPVLPTVKITTYAWDQSEKFLKLYITVPGAAPGQDGRIRFDVQNKSVDLNADDIAGKNYFFNLKGLLHPIIADGSTFKLKKDEILLMLKKKDDGRTWTYITEVEMINKEKNKPKMDDNSDPNASLMKMMKQMYDEGDDEVKRNINKAWSENQEKKRGGGGGEMGFGDFM